MENTNKNTTKRLTQRERLLQKLAKIDAQNRAIEPYYLAIKEQVNKIVTLGQEDDNLTAQSKANLRSLEKLIMSGIKRRMEDGSEEAEDSTEEAEDGSEEGVK